MSNKSMYKKHMSKKVEVPIEDDIVYTLVRPRASATIKLRAMMADMKEGDEDSNRMLKVAATALRHCMPSNEEWSDDELMDLIITTGGELGELSTKAMTLCGMPVQAALDSMDRIGEDPSSSPGDTE